MSIVVLGVHKSNLSIDNKPVFFETFIEMEKYSFFDKSSRTATARKTRMENSYRNEVFYLVGGEKEHVKDRYVPIYKRKDGLSFPVVFTDAGMADYTGKEIVAWVKRKGKTTFVMKMGQEEPK